MLTPDDERTLQVLEPAEQGMLSMYRLRHACHPDHTVPLVIRNTIKVLNQFGLLDGDNITYAGRAKLAELREKGRGE